MKKLSISLALISALTLTFSGCKKDDDTESPVISLNGDNPDFSVLKFAYVDEGADATDNNDATVTVNTSGTVNSNAAGSYQLTYSASDAAGNPSEEIRDVYVVNLSSATYSASDDCGTGATAYTEAITVTNTAINFSRFANYDNGSVNGTISGDNTTGFTITIPSQTVMCGTPAANRSFSGTGTISFTDNGGTIVRNISISYTEVTNGSSVSCSDTYTK
ncbi:hypothetical protein BH11BAC2_BH11BAC2_24680 [soil metagenome]